MKLTHVGIIGLGLIGGSIAKSLRSHFGRSITIYGSNASIDRTKQAVNDGIIDMVLDEQAIPSDIQILIIATPVRTSMTVLKRLDIPKQCITIDVCSTKLEICTLAESLFSNAGTFIGTHPMAGKEVSGFEHADAELFQGKPWIVCPVSPTKKAQIEQVFSFITTLGGIPVLMEPDEHDAVIAWASHASLALSSILFHAASTTQEWDQIASIASTGFRDTTRLASENPTMKFDIMTTNTDHILHTLRNIQEEIDSFCRMLENKEEDTLLTYLQSTQKKRNTWLAHRQDLTK